MRTEFSRDIFTIPKYIYFVIVLALAVVFQVGLCSLWAGEYIESELSLSKTIELALDYNSQRRVNKKNLPPEDVIFLVKKYYYQIQTQVDQLDTTEEVREHFQKAIDKSEEVFEKGEGNVSQSDITKLKLGLSDTLNDIVSLKHAIQIARLNLGEFIDKELRPGRDIVKTEIIPVPFSYSSFDVYLEAKNLSPSPRKIEGVGVASSKIFVQIGEGDRLTLHKAFIAAKEATAKVTLGKKNRKITRALLVAEVANYDFGIGDSQELFEALIVYTRVLVGYLDSIYTLNVAVAELEKLTDAIYR